MNAAQRARKRWKREKNKRVVRVDADEPPAQQFHYLHVPKKEDAEELARGFILRGRAATMTHQPTFDPPQPGDRAQDRPLPWLVKVAASEAEMDNPGFFFDKYQDFAAQFGGEYGGCV